jgi:hypothetical protein
MVQKYVNIIRLLHHCNIDVSSQPIDVQRALKIIKAEFAASEAGILQIGDYEFTKQAVLDLFDKANIQQIIEWELAIHNNNILTKLLEQNTGVWFGVFDALKPLKSDAFIQQYSAYFADVVNRITKKSLAFSSHYDTEMALALMPLILPEHREHAMQPMRMFFMDINKIIRNTNDDQFYTSLVRLSHFSSDGWYKYFNRIPIEFDYLKDEIVASLIDIMVMNNKKPLTPEVLNFSRGLIQVRGLRPDIQQVVHSNHEIFSKRSSATSDSEYDGWAIIRYIFFALFILFKIVQFLSMA